MEDELIRDSYSKLSTPELLFIVSSKTGYTDFALHVASAELAGRQVSQKVIDEFKILHDNLERTFPKPDIFQDLGMMRKAFFYFLWLPMFSRSVRTEYSLAGYLLKVWQSNYYGVLGFVGCMLALMMGQHSVTAVSMLTIWTIGFVLALTFDSLYNLNRQRRKLQRLSDEGKLDLEW